MELVAPNELRECILFTYEVEQDTGSTVSPLPHVIVFCKLFQVVDFSS